jgi:hypothetical protein
MENQGNPNNADSFIDDAHAPNQDEDERNLIDEFERRAVRERSRYFGFVGVVIFVFGVFVALQIIQYYWIIFSVMVIGQFWLSWREWRCPYCNVWFRWDGSVISPFFSSSPLWCPKCKGRLL